MVAPPCKHCADRVMGCHGTCKEYNDWAVKRREELKAERETMPKTIHASQFTGTSPKPGTNRKTRRSRH